MVTVSRIKSLLNPSLQQQIANNDDLVNQIISMRYNFVIKVFGEVPEDISDFLVENLVLSDLYNRYNQLQLTEYYYKRAVEFMENLQSGKFYKAPADNVIVRSEPRIFTKEEFKKW